MGIRIQEQVGPGHAWKVQGAGGGWYGEPHQGDLALCRFFDSIPLPNSWQVAQRQGTAGSNTWGHGSCPLHCCACICLFYSSMLKLISEVLSKGM